MEVNFPVMASNYSCKTILGARKPERSLLHLLRKQRKKNICCEDFSKMKQNSSLETYFIFIMSTVGDKDNRCTLFSSQASPSLNNRSYEHTRLILFKLQ